MRLKTEDIRALLFAALNGQLRYNELSEAVKSMPEDDPFLQKTIEDLYDAVEHYPVSFWKRKPLDSIWIKSDEYRRIVLDLVVLSTPNSEHLDSPSLFAEYSRLESIDVPAHQLEERYLQLD